MKTLKHTIKKKWFDMILSGEKKEEYKEIKPFWLSRLCWNDEEITKRQLSDAISDMKTFSGKSKSFENIRELLDYHNLNFCEFDEHHFFNGAYFSEKIPNYKIKAKGIRIGTGKPEWGAVEGVNYFIIELGEILK